jgi:hypothetical protein
VHGGFTAWLVDTCVRTLMQELMGRSTSALMISLSTSTFWHETGGVSLNLSVNYFHPILVYVLRERTIADISGTKLRVVAKLLKVSNAIATIQCDVGYLVPSRLMIDLRRQRQAVGFRSTHKVAPRQSQAIVDASKRQTAYLAI